MTQKIYVDEPTEVKLPANFFEMSNQDLKTLYRELMEKLKKVCLSKMEFQFKTMKGFDDSRKVRWYSEDGPVTRNAKGPVTTLNIEVFMPITVIARTHPKSQIGGKLQENHDRYNKWRGRIVCILRALKELEN